MITYLQRDTPLDNNINVCNAKWDAPSENNISVCDHYGHDRKWMANGMQRINFKIWPWFEHRFQKGFD